MILKQGIESLPYFEDDIAITKHIKFITFEFNYLSISRYYVKINDLTSFINNYINILLKYNKIKINNINDMDEIYDKFISSRYIFDILTQTKNFKNVMKYEVSEASSPLYDEIENTKNYNDPQFLYIYDNRLCFLFNDFNNDFFKILLTTNSVTDYYKRFIIQLFNPDYNTIYSDIYILTVYFYGSNLSFEEFINKHNYITDNYKLLTIIINYLNKSGNVYLNCHSIEKYNNKNYFEIYLLMFCNELIKYCNYDKLLINIMRNIKYDIWLRYHSQLKMKKTLIEYIKNNKPELLEKHIIINHNIYNSLHKTFPNNDNIILFSDFCNECKSIYKDKIYEFNPYKGNDIKEKKFNNLYRVMSGCGKEYLENKMDMEIVQYNIEEILCESSYRRYYIGQVRNAFMQLLINNEFDEFIILYKAISTLRKDIKALFYKIISKHEINILKTMFKLDIEIFDI